MLSKIGGIIFATIIVLTILGGIFALEGLVFSFLWNIAFPSYKISLISGMAAALLFNIFVAGVKK